MSLPDADPATWWEQYGYRLNGRPVPPGTTENAEDVAAGGVDRAAASSVERGAASGVDQVAGAGRAPGSAVPDPAGDSAGGRTGDRTGGTGAWAAVAPGGPNAGATRGVPADPARGVRTGAFPSVAGSLPRSPGAVAAPLFRPGTEPVAPQSPGGSPDPAILDPDSLLAPRPTGWRAVARGERRPGAAELLEQERIGRIRRPLAGTQRVAVVSLKGGVGKTTVTAGLGLVLAQYRGDRVIAVDADPAVGTLADRLTGETGRTIRDLLAALPGVDSWTAVSSFTSLAGRLQVLASEQDPGPGAGLTRIDYRRVDDVLGRFFTVVLTDSGTGMLHPAMSGTLQVADSLIVVGSPTVDAAARAGQTIEWLVAHGCRWLVERAIVVLSGDRSSPQVDTGQVREYFAQRCRAVVDVPADPHLTAGGRIHLDRLRPATRAAFTELAALVVDGFEAGERDGRAWGGA